MDSGAVITMLAGAIAAVWGVTVWLVKNMIVREREICNERLADAAKVIDMWRARAERLEKDLEGWRDIALQNTGLARTALRAGTRGRGVPHGKDGPP